MGSLRIIAGQLRGRKIDVPAAAVRPTGDRVREALFNILGPSIAGAVVLDAYSGSGALGFECASRGARRVVMIEVDRTIARALDENVARFGLADRVEVVRGAAVESLAGTGRVAGPFDLILADPPYDSDEVERFLPVAAPHLAPDGRIVIERESRGPEPARPVGGLSRVRTARYGRASLDFYCREPSGPTG